MYYCTTSDISKADELYQEWKDEHPEWVGKEEAIISNTTQIVCIEDGKVIGAEQVVGMYDPVWKVWYGLMENGYVSKNHRGKGVFRALNAHCKTQAFALGYTCLRWHCGADKVEAIKCHDTTEGVIRGVAFKCNL